MTCSSGQREHNGQCCKLCPKGKYVADNCSSASTTKCETCAHGTYMAQSNYLKNCLPCTQCQENQREVKVCESDSDRQCDCKEGFYCKSFSEGHCVHCVKVSVCPPGTGVSAKPTNKTNTICRPCMPGTFSNVTDYSTPCLSHTQCETHGYHLKTPGTDKTNTECGAKLNNCSQWMVPAGLWAGFIVTVLISLIIVLLYRRYKRKSQQTVSISVSSQSYGSPVLPPDIIKYPNSPELKTLFEKDEFSFNTGDCSLECDGINMTTMTASEKYGNAVCCDHYGGLHTTSNPSILQSEPQEDEWFGV